MVWGKGLVQMEEKVALAKRSERAEECTRVGEVTEDWGGEEQEWKRERKRERGAHMRREGDGEGEDEGEREREREG